MHCPTLAELPPPPLGKTGWPWTVETAPLPVARPDGTPWPRISIVTPSYKQGEFIEETIRSILLQGYPNLEYIVVDGGSQDASVDVIKKYAKWLAHWESVQDRGQSDAINKGFRRSTGDVFQFINSDDLLCEGALHRVGLAWEPNAMVAGAVENFGPAGVVETIENRGLTVRGFLQDHGGAIMQQPGAFLPARLLREYFHPNLLREDLHYIFDWYLLVCVLGINGNSVRYLGHPVARFRLHDASKTVSQSGQFEKEHGLVRQLLAVDPLREFFPSDIRHDLARRLARSSVVNAIEAEGSRIERSRLLIRALASAPSLIRDRFFWGAVKRVARHGSP